MSRRPVRFDIRQAGKQIALLLGVLAAANVAFYVLVGRPVAKEYGQLLDGSNPTFEKLKQREELVSDLELFHTAVQQAELDLTRLHDEILSTRDERMVKAHAELARLCGKFQIDLETVGFSHELLLDEELDRMVMTVPLEGGYANLRKFLRAVEGSDKFLIVERVALGRGKEGGVLLSLDITLATYFNAPQHLIDKKRALGRRGRRRA